MNNNTENTGVEVTTKEFVTISDASEILGVSPDTIRRWEKAGRLHSQRLDGKNRYFDVEELHRFLSMQPLSTTEVAALLGVSPSTIRRLEAQGLIRAERDHNGKRQYDKQNIENYVNSLQGSNASQTPDVTQEKIEESPVQYSHVAGLEVAYAAVEPTPSIGNITPPYNAPAPKQPLRDRLELIKNKIQTKKPLGGTPSVPRMFWHLQNAIVYAIAGSMVVILIILAFMLTSPSSTGDLFWGTPPESRSPVVRVLKPFAERSLNLVEIVSPTTRKKVLEYAVTPPSSMFNSDADENGTFSAPTTELVTNLNSEYVGGHKPGSGKGDLAVLPITGNKIADKSVTGVDLSDGTIQLTNLSPALQALINGKTSGSGATGPQGPAGPTGPQGPQGPQGPTGGGVGNVVAGSGLLGGGSSTTVTLQVDTGNSTEIVSNSIEVRMATSGSTTTTSSNSGLEVTSQGLRMIGGCNLGQILKWNGSAWACGADNSGSGSLDVQTSDGGSFVSGVSNIQFGPSSNSTEQFSVTNLGSGQVRIQLGTNVLLTSNFAATLDPIYANATETPAAGDITGSFAGGFFMSADAVALGTDTTGNYVAAVGGGAGLTVTGSGSENASVSLALDVATTGTTATLSSNSGLELGPDGLRLVGGCSNNQILKWNGSAWVCSADSDSGSMTVQENDTTVSSAVNTLDFLGNDFALTESPAGEINIAIDYTNSGIARTTQNAVITGSWLFTDNAFAIRDNVDTSKQVAFQLSGVSPSTTRTLTVPNNDGTIITTGNLSDITSVGTVTSGTWQGTTVGAQYGGTGINGTTAANGTLLIGNGSGYTLTTLTQGSGIAITNGSGSITIAAALGTSISGSEIELDAVTLGSQTVGNYVQSVVAGAGLTGDVASEGGTASLAIGAGNGISVAADSIAVSVQGNKGLEVDGSGLSLIDCNVNEILKYNGSNQWACAADNGTGSAPTLQDIYNNDTDGGNAVIELTSADGGLRVRDNITPIGASLFSVQNNDASVTYLAVSASGISVTGTGTFSGLLTANGGLTLETGDAFTINGEAFTDLTGSGLGISGGLLNVQYGSTANTAVQGNTTFTCASGTGNLTGGGNTITMGSGGSCNAISTNNAVAFSTSVATPLITNAGVLSLTTTGAGNDIIIDSADQIILSDFNCSTFDNGGVLTVDASGQLICGNDDGGAAGTVTGSGTANRIPLYTGASSLGDSWLAQNTSTLELDTTRNLSLLGGNLSVTGTGLFTGLITANGGITVEVGDTFTINGEGFTDLTGTGLAISGGALQATLGTSISSGEIDNDAVALGTQTTGNYVNNVTAGNGVNVTGTAGEGWSPTIAVLYGSTANTAVQGNTTFTCASGTGNLTGGGNTITMGSGGSCNAISTNNAVSFSTSVTTPLLTSAGWMMIQTQATIGSDDIVFETAGSEKMRLLENGNLFFEKGTNDATISIAAPSGADAVYTLSGSSGTVLTSANYTTSLDATYVNIGESPAAGDIAGSFSSGLTIGAGTVTNAKLQNSSISTSFGTNLSGSASVSLGGTLSVSVSATPSFTSVTATTFSGALSGNASTASALAANPADCAANTFATTIAASGDLTCAALTDADVPDTLTIGASSTVADGALSTNVTKLGSAIDLATSEVSGNLRAINLQSAAADLGAANVNIDLSNTNGSFVTNLTVDGTITATTFSGNLTGNVTGNASTASALAANPADCAANTFANAIAANGDLTCASVSKSALTSSGTLGFTWADSEVSDTLTASILIGSGSTTNAVDLATAEVAGVLGVANGGTGLNGSTAANGQLLIGNGSGYSQATLGQGNGITITNGAGTISIASSVQANKGLEVDGNGLSLIDCSSGEILKYNGSNQWTCAADNGTGTAPTLHDSYANDTDGGNAVIGLTSADGAVIIRDSATPIGGTLFAIQSNAGGTSYLDVTTSGITTSGTINGLTVSSGTITAGTWNGSALTDAYVSDTLTSSSFIGSGSTTNAVDLATAEVAGNLRATNLQSAAADLGAANVNIDLSNTNGSFVTNLTVDGTITAATFVGALSGNASTASALAANPTDCAVNTFATTIAANGDLTCVSITDADVPDTITVNNATNATNATNLIGSGSTTNAVDLATAEVAGNLRATNLQAAGTDLGAANVNIDLSNTNGGGFVTNLTVDGTITAATFVGALSGNASTATALAANPADCAANTFATAIAANGDLACSSVGKSALANNGTLGFSWSDAEIADTLTASIFIGSGSTTNAVDLATAEVAGTLRATNLQAVGADLGAVNVNIDLSNTNGSFVTNLTVDGTITAATFSGNLTGNASTATALAANPTDCSANQFATAIAANGNLSCAALTDADVPDALTIGASSTVADGALSANVTKLGSAIDLATTEVSGILPVANGGTGASSLNDLIALGTHTTGNYIATLGTLTGLSTTGNTGEGATPTLAVLYGSTANTAVQGNTTFTCASGTGNLTGGGNTVTMGSGGSCNAISTNNAVSFSTSVTTPLLQNAGLTIASTGANSLIFQTNSTTRLTIDSAGVSTFAGNVTVSSGGITVTGNSTITGTLSGLTGLTVASGGASISGGLNNNSGGITNAGAISGATTLSLSGTTTGTIITSSYSSPTVQTGSLTGALLDFSNNFTGSQGRAITGVDVAFPGISVTGSVTNYTGFNIGSATNLSATAGTINWNGASYTMPNIDANGGTITSNGLRVITGTITNGGTMNGMNVIAQGVTHGTLNGLNIGAITAGAGAETGIKIGTGWDTAIDLSAAMGTAALSIGSNNITTSGATISAAELNLLDGHGDSGSTLVDTNDAVNTAITGTGVLGAGSIGTGFGAIDVGTDNITTTGTIGTAATTTFTGGSATFSTAISTPLLQNAGALTLSANATAGADDIIFSTAGSEKWRLLENGNFQSTASRTIDLSNASATTLTLTNSGSGVLGLSVEGGATFGANLAVTTGGITVTGNSTITGTLSGLTGLTVASGGASISGGLNNNSGGITNAGAVSGATSITSSGNISISNTSVYQQNGLSGISVTCGGGQVYVGGGVRVSGGIITSGSCTNDGLSDQRLKQNITAVGDLTLQKIKSVNTVGFDFDCTNSYFATTNTYCNTEGQTGVIAQELAQVFPELVRQNEDGYYEVDYQGLNIYTLKAVQELSGMVDELMVLKGQVDDLEGRVASLESSSGVTNEYGEEVYIEDLTVGNMTVNMDLFTQGSLTVAGNANFQAEAFFQELVMFGNSVIFARDVQFQDTVSFSNNTGGYALINPGQQTVRVTFTKPFAQAPIVSVSLADGKFVQYSYKNVTADGFDIVLNTPAFEQLQFSWIALSVTNPNTVSQP